MGFSEHKGVGRIDRNYHALAKTVRAWTRTHYLTIRDELPDVADAVLMGAITYDAEARRLVATLEKFLRKEAPREYLDLVPTPIAQSGT